MDTRTRTHARTHTHVQDLNSRTLICARMPAQAHAQTHIESPHTFIHLIILVTVVVPAVC